MEQCNSTKQNCTFGNVSENCNNDDWKIYSLREKEDEAINDICWQMKEFENRLMF